MAYSVQVTFSCDDPERMAEFWSAALGYIVQPPPPGYETWEEFADTMGISEANRGDISAVVDPDGVGPRLLFERWDGGEANKRVHLDINVFVDEELTIEDRDQRLAEERKRLEALGATYHRMASGFAGETWLEMFDPEGNWFCVQ